MALQDREYLTQAEYGQYKGYTTRAYVTKLKQNGMLVMTPNGKMVDRAATDKLIEQLSDPAKQPVAERHAEGRKKKREATAPPTAREGGSAANGREPLPPAAPPSSDDLQGKTGKVYQHSRALNEKYKAMTAKREYEVATGVLLVADEVVAVIADAGTVVRNRLESLPDILAPQLAAEMDEAKVRAVLIDHIELLLTELSRQFGKVAGAK